jgi:hypothetical protein
VVTQKKASKNPPHRSYPTRLKKLKTRTQNFRTPSVETAEECFFGVDSVSSVHSVGVKTCRCAAQLFGVISLLKDPFRYALVPDQLSGPNTADCAG